MMRKMRCGDFNFPKMMLLLAGVVLLPLMVRCQHKEQAKTAAKTSVATTAVPADFNPAMPGFDTINSDRKAIEIADRVMKNMGGYKAWDSTRYIAFSFYGQYNIWDKHTGWFRHEREKMVTLINLNNQDARLYLDGIPRTNPNELGEARQQAQIYWMANAYWLALPYKLKDSGVTLKYLGEENTQDGRPADVLQMTFTGVGITPQNKHKVWVDKEKGLVTQWAFFNTAEDKEPTFVRRFADYKTFGGIKLSLDRGSKDDNLFITDVVVTNYLPNRTFFSSVSLNKERVKEEAQLKPENEAEVKNQKKK